MRIPIALLFAVALCAGAVTVSYAAEKKKKGEIDLPTPPPQPVPAKVEVMRTGHAQIPLRIYGRQREVLKFLIRAAPQSGKLSEVTPAGRESATVYYQPPQDLAVRSEKFTYAVQNSAGVSAPAEVTITIVDEATRLIVPDTVRFGPILAGSTARQEIVIYNDGGGLAEGEVLVDGEWRMEGNAAYHLARGDRERFELVFAPKVGGTARRELRYTSHPDRVTTLIGEAQTPLTVEPAAVALRVSGDDTSRFGAVEITNHTSEDQVVSLKGSDRWKLPATLPMKAKAKETLMLKLPADDTAAVNEEIVLAAAGIEVRLPVQAPVAPARLMPFSTAVALPPGGPRTSGEVAVRNAGGTPGFWRVEASAPFVIQPAELRLQPMQEAKVAVRVESLDGGHFEGPVRFMGEQQTLPVMVAADLSGTAAAMSTGASTTRAASPATAGSEATAESAPSPPVVDPIFFTEAFQPPPIASSKVRVVETTSSQARLEWPEELTSGKAVQMEVQKLSLDAERKLQTQWIVLRNVKLQSGAGVVKATINGLPDNMLQTIRGSTVEAGNTAPHLVFVVDVATQPAVHVLRFTPLRGLGLAAALCAGVVVWQAWRRRRAAAI